MKTTYLLLFLGILSLTAQTTHHINPWTSNTNGDLTIDQGDTVIWTSVGTHTVTTLSGVASFNSGSLSSGETFQFTFNTPGTTDYQCNFHPSNMTGTITVNSTASLEDFQSVVFNYAPNPVQHQLSINAERSITQVEIFSILGKKMLSKQFNSDKVQFDISSLKRNIYFTKLKFDDDSYGVFRLLKE